MEKGKERNTRITRGEGCKGSLSIESVEKKLNFNETSCATHIAFNQTMQPLLIMLNK